MSIFDSVVVTEIVSALTVTSIENRIDTTVNRNHYGLSFCLEGEITYLHNGVKYVSDEYNAVILPKGETYEIYRNRSGIFPVINFETLTPLCDTICLIPIGDAVSLFADFSTLRGYLRFDRDRAKAMSVFYSMLYKLSTELQDVGAIAPAVEYMNQNFTDADISNSFLADKCGLSEVYFRRLFCNKFGFTPRQHIIALRVEKAKELLSDGILKISAIAEECGFTNQYHFTRTFKEKTGVTPSEYAKKQRNYRL